MADQAIVIVEPIMDSLFGVKFTTLGDAVGGNGFSFGQSPMQSNVRMWGWPSEPPYDGRFSYYCDNKTHSSGSHSAMNGCPVTQGASGGPWLIDRTGDDQGTIYAVLNKGYGGFMFAAPFGIPFFTIWMLATFSQIHI